MFSFFNSKGEENVRDILRSVDRLKYKMILHSFVVGLLAGGVIVVYRILGEHLLSILKKTYLIHGKNPVVIVFIFLTLILVSFMVSFCVKKEPNISGSGIPQVEGIIMRKLETNWRKVLVYKFFGGILTLASGLSVGREGPSIQMGAAIGEGISKTSNKMDYEHKYLITSGASAGLAAAFNAPLAGVMFALEEVHKNFSPIVLMSAMVSAVTADMTTKLVLGIRPSLMFSQLKIMPLKYYWALIFLGVVLGVGGYFFNNGVVFSKKMFKRLPIRLEFKIAIPFILSGIIGLTLPGLLGGGHSLILELGQMKLTLGIIFLFLIIKYIFTFISFGSGVPGGIFLPLLAIGSLLGSFVGVVSTSYLGVPEVFLMNFIVLSMAGHFASTVKAPITGIILIFEMTGSFEQLLPLSVVAFTSIIVSDLLKVSPVYEVLLKNILGGDVEPYRGEESKKTLVEFSVHLGSEIEGKHISEIKWPNKSLVVSISRGSDEIIPRGDTRIVEGDMLTVMINQVESAEVISYLKELTSKHYIS